MGAIIQLTSSAVVETSNGTGKALAADPMTEAITAARLPA
jgi:hypothetical protein